jgi:hypothetical protein
VNNFITSRTVLLLSTLFAAGCAVGTESLFGDRSGDQALDSGDDALGGGGAGATDPPVACSVDTDCGAAGECEHGFCEPHAQDDVPGEGQCLADADCGEGFECEHGLCQVDTDDGDEKEDEAEDADKDAEDLDDEEGTDEADEPEQADPEEGEEAPDAEEPEEPGADGE